MSFKEKMYRLANRRPREEEIREKVKIIHELIQEKLDQKRSTNQVKAQAERTSPEQIKTDFYLDALAVANKKGEIIKSDGEENFKELLKDKELPQYVTEQFPDTKLFTIRNNGQNKLIYKEEDRFYLMKTPGTISIPEIKRITKKLK